MDKREWLDRVERHRSSLEELIGIYHPSSQSETNPRRLPITASWAEVACERVRDRIRDRDGQESPIMRFRKSLEEKDAVTVRSILGETWFGVPKSCLSFWSIQGFRELVDLLEDSDICDEEDGVLETDRDGL